MKNKNIGMSTAAKRKAQYASLASEKDKSSRNEALEKAMGEGASNVKGGKVEVEYEETKEVDGKVVVSVVKKLETAAHVVPKLPSSEGTRSAKRARLKASRHRLVKAEKHAVSRCGNVGCKRCFPELNRSRRQITGGTRA
jgi:hypothetical protein